MEKHRKLLKKLRFAPHKKIVRCKESEAYEKPATNEKPNLSYLECDVEQLQKKYGITLEMQHGFLPATRIPGTDLIVESVLILSFAFSRDGNPWVISSATICASADKIREKEKQVIDLLIEKSNDSAMCDFDGEGKVMLGCFSNVYVATIQPSDVPVIPDGNTYYCMKSNGFEFSNVENQEEYEQLMHTQPDDVFVFRLIKENVAHPK